MVNFFYKTPVNCLPLWDLNLKIAVQYKIFTRKSLLPEQEGVNVAKTAMQDYKILMIGSFTIFKFQCLTFNLLICIYFQIDLYILDIINLVCVFYKWNSQNVAVRIHVLLPFCFVKAVSIIIEPFTIKTTAVSGVS